MNRENIRKIRILVAVLIFITIAAGCGTQQPDDGAQDIGSSANKIDVVVTTTILGDVVGAVGGDLIDLEVLLPAGSDPHAYQLTPRDVVALEDADLVFINGLGLESFLEPVLDNVHEDTEVITVSDGIRVMNVPDNGGDAEETGTMDPHVWFDPLNVVIWTDNIEAAFSKVDPTNQDKYQDNAENYREQLKNLDDWIVDRFELLPPEKRLIVTDHDSLGYLVERYGLELIGTVIPGFSTQSQPSAKEMATLLDVISQRGIMAVFISDSANSSLAEQIARDSGIHLIPLSTGSLTVATGEAPSYLEFMRVNVEKIADALSVSD